MPTVSIGAAGRRRAAITLVLAGLAVVISLLVSQEPSAARGGFALTATLAAAFFVARLLSIRLPQGDEVYATLAVGLVGLTLLSPLLVVAASLAGGVVDVLARSSHSTRKQSVRRLLDAIRGASVFGLVAPWQLVLHPLMSSAVGGEEIILWTLAAGISYALLDILTTAMQQSVEGIPMSQAVLSLISPLGAVYVVHIPMAAVVLRLHGAPGGWPFPVAMLLTLILQNAFNLYLRIRRAYAETIEALAHAAEMDRPHDSGHARRVADLSVAVGRRLGLSSHDLEQVGYAALLHDIGRLGEATESDGALHARRGAEIAGAIPFLAEVAPLIWSEMEQDATQPIGETIVRTCSRYDRLMTELGAEIALSRLEPEHSADYQRVRQALQAAVMAKITRVVQ